MNNTNYVRQHLHLCSMKDRRLVLPGEQIQYFVLSNFHTQVKKWHRIADYWIKHTVCEKLSMCSKYSFNYINWLFCSQGVRFDQAGLVT